MKESKNINIMYLLHAKCHFFLFNTIYELHMKAYEVGYFNFNYSKPIKYKVLNTILYLKK